MPALHKVKVPSIGNPNAKIMVVGESPGKNEAIRGEPFIGDSGNRLMKTFSAMGIDRKDLFITNAVKYMPYVQPDPLAKKSKIAKKDQDDKRSYFFRKVPQEAMDARGNPILLKSGAPKFVKVEVPTDAFMEGIVELAQEIIAVKPNVILALGNYALWALRQHEGIMNWRGSILESALIKGQKMVPSIHPAWFQRTRMFHRLPLFEWDLRRVVEESKYPELRLPQAEFITDPTDEQVEEAVERLLKAPYFVTDTEWYGPESFAYAGFSDSKDWAIIIPANTMTRWRAIKTLMGSPVPKVIQNAAFDYVALARAGIHVENIQHDLMVAWHACWTDLRSKSLATIASVLTRWPYYKEEGAFIGKDDERGQIYCGMDCVAEFESMQKILGEEFHITGSRGGYDVSMSIANTMLKASARGVLADRAKLLRLKKEHEERSARTLKVLSDMFGVEINVRSPPQIAHIVYDVLGVKREMRSTAQDVLMDIAAAEKRNEVKEILTAIVRARQDLNMVSRYLNEGIIDSDGRIRTNWNLAGTRSGRLSSTETWWNSWAMQTVPDIARSVAIADPGNIFIAPDYEQAEARVVAVICDDWELLKAMDEKKDIHTMLAAQLPFGLTYEELVALIEKHGKDNVAERFLAKKCRHALNYVMGVPTFKATVNREYLDTGVGITYSEAEAIRNTYYELHPALNAWWEEVKAKMKNPGYLENSWGRRRNVLGSIDQALTEYVSFEPQSDVADLTTTSIAATVAEAPWMLVDAHMHDGVLFQVPEDRVHEAADVIKRNFIRPMRVRKEFIKIPIELKIGKSWGSMSKYKEAA